VPRVKGVRPRMPSGCGKAAKARRQLRGIGGEMAGGGGMAQRALKVALGEVVCGSALLPNLRAV